MRKENSELRPHCTECYAEFEDMQALRLHMHSNHFRRCYFIHWANLTVAPRCCIVMFFALQTFGVRYFLIRRNGAIASTNCVSFSALFVV